MVPLTHNQRVAGSIPVICLSTSFPSARHFTHIATLHPGVEVCTQQDAIVIVYEISHAPATWLVATMFPSELNLCIVSPWDIVTGYKGPCI